MDFHFLHSGQRFVWDTEKAVSNLAKHGISFEIACQVFFDRFVCIEDASVGNERRDAAIGLTERWMLLLVVHLVREDHAIRIISARPTTAWERRRYEDSE